MELRDKFSPEKLALATYAERKEPPPSFRSLIRDFCDYTSAHGFGRINASRHWIRTILWILLCVAAVTMTTVQLHMLYKKYQSRPLTTLVEIETATVRIAAILPFLILAEFGQFLFKYGCCLLGKLKIHKLFVGISVKALGKGQKAVNVTGSNWQKSYNNCSLIMHFKDSTDLDPVLASLGLKVAPWP